VRPRIIVSLVVAAVVGASLTVLALLDPLALFGASLAGGLSCLVLAFLALGVSWGLARHTRYLARQQASAAELDWHGWRFFAWFAGHHLVWAALSLLIAAMLLGFGGTGKLVLVIVAGMLATASMMLIALIAALVFLKPQRAAGLALCWVEEFDTTPDKAGHWFSAALSLGERYRLLAEQSARAAVWDVHGRRTSRSFVRRMTELRGRVETAGSVTPINFCPSLWTRFEREVALRGAALAVPFLLAAAIIAVLPTPPGLAELFYPAPAGAPIAASGPLAGPPASGQIEQPAGQQGGGQTQDGSQQGSQGQGGSQQGSQGGNQQGSQGQGGSQQGSQQGSQGQGSQGQSGSQQGNQGQGGQGQSGSQGQSGNQQGNQGQGGQGQSGSQGQGSQGQGGSQQGSQGQGGNQQNGQQGSQGQGGSQQGSQGQGGSQQGSQGQSGNQQNGQQNGLPNSQTGGGGGGGGGGPGDGRGGAGGSSIPGGSTGEVNTRPGTIRPMAGGASQPIAVDVPAIRAPNAPPADASTPNAQPTGQAGQPPADATSSDRAPGSPVARPAPPSLTQYIPNWILTLLGGGPR